jgi:dihydrolipoamide dehydrogenase
VASAAFDVIVIGGGPGGYVAAIRAAQLGFKVCCVDEWKDPKGKASLGGTCLNVGCIPSKALLESSENFERAAHKFAAHGIKVGSVELDMATFMARKDKIVDQLTGGVAYLFKKNKVASVHGRGRFVSAARPYQIEVLGEGKSQTLTAEHVVIASGSVPRNLPGVPVDNDAILDNAGALSLPQVPARLGVIGAGVIGLELGSVFKRLGAEVTLLEALPTFLSAADEQVVQAAWKTFTKEQGLGIELGVKIQSVKRDAAGITVHYLGSDAAARDLAVDKLIVAVGRVPNTEGLQLSAAGLTTNARGFIEVDDRCRTALPGIYAVGDVVRGPMLAHKASEEGVAVAELIAGQAGHVNLDTIPWVIYSAPEIAWVGKNERELKAAGIEFHSGSFPYSANGRAKALGDTTGFVKMLAAAKTDRILGVHIIGPYASETIAEAVVAMEFGASSEDIARIVHAHPSLSEAFHEAALAVDRRALHI